MLLSGASSGSGFSKVMLQRFIVYDSSGCRKWRLKFIRMKNEPK